MTKPPKRYERRLVEITVCQEVIPGGWPAWAVKEWNTCGCPKCDQDGHWFELTQWFDTKEEAERSGTGPYWHEGKTL